MSNHFSFEDLEVWQKSIEFADEAIQIVDELNQRISLGLPRGGSLRTCGPGGARDIFSRHVRHVRKVNIINKENLAYFAPFARGFLD